MNIILCIILMIDVCCWRVVIILRRKAADTIELLIQYKYSHWLPVYTQQFPSRHPRHSSSQSKQINTWTKTYIKIMEISYPIILSQPESSLTYQSNWVKRMYILHFYCSIMNETLGFCYWCTQFEAVPLPEVLCAMRKMERWDELRER